MAINTLREKVEQVLDSLSEKRLEVALDFLSYLQEREGAEALMRLQRQSKAYQEWVGPENDVYDEVFKDEAR